MYLKAKLVAIDGMMWLICFTAFSSSLTTKTFAEMWALKKPQEGTSKPTKQYRKQPVQESAIVP